MTIEAERRYTPASAALPNELRDSMVGLALLGAAANVIMQLSWLPIGHGVALSTVHSGRADIHPIKRLRTTVSYLAIATLGTETERRQYRHQINRQHAQVHSAPGDAVEYNAFSPELQLWVAACLAKGSDDIYRLFHPDATDAELDLVYAHAERLSTTLQVSSDMWPADREAFEHYWQEGLTRIQMDDVTRPYLREVANSTFILKPLGIWAKPLGLLIAPISDFFTGGFLPEPFREELGLAWSDRRQAQFDSVMAVLVAITRRTPRLLREFPFNYFLWDTRRRLRAGRSVV